MGAISAGNQTLLRPPTKHKTVERVYGFGYPAAWSGRVNNTSIARGDQTVAYDTGSLSTNFAFGDLQAGMLVLFGSSAGASDIGRRRLLSISGNATSGTIIVDWYDDMSLSDDDFITIINFFPPWPKFSWFTSTGPDFRVDGPPSGSGGAGIDYSDQNETPPPLVLLNRNYAGEGHTAAQKWWLADGVSDSDVAGVWQAIGAYAQAESYYNLDTIGTNDLSVGSAPTWAAASGWTFTSDYLDTGITPASDYTMIVRCVNTGGSGRQHVMGSAATNANFRMDVGDGAAITYGDATSSTFAGDYTDGVACMAANQFYFDGSLIGSVNGTFSGSPIDIFIGAFNNAGSPSDSWPGTVQAAVIYNTTLTAAQIATISTKMAALTSTDNPFAINLDATNSQAVADGASLSTYAWSFTPSSADAVIADTTASSTRFYPSVSSSAQRFQLHCAVTDDNANSSTAHRAVQVGGGIAEFSRSAITHQFDSPAVNCSVTLTSPDTSDSNAIRPIVDYSDFPPMGLVTIAAEDYYDTTQSTISFRDDSAYTDRQHIVYSGYLVDETDDLLDAGDGTVTLNLVTAYDMFMYSLSLTGVDSPTDWYEMDSTLMTVAGNLFHLFYYHSTLMDIMDWNLPWSDTTKRSANELFTEGGILQRARSLVDSRLMGMTATPQGEIWVETDLNLRSSSDRSSATTTLTLQDSDLTSSRRARWPKRADRIRVLLSGGSSQGLLDTFTPFFAASQDVARAEGVPTVVPIDNLMLADQDEANRLAGRIATVHAEGFTEINLQLSGNYREVFSPADQQKVNLGNVFAGSLRPNLRGYTDLESAVVVVRQVSHSYDPATLTTTVSVIADVIPAEGLDGVTLTAPSVPADASSGDDDSDSSFALPDPPKWPPVPPSEASPAGAALADGTDGSYWTFDTGSSTDQRNDSLTASGTETLALYSWWKTQFGNNSSNPEDAIAHWGGSGFLRKTTDAGKNWTDLTSRLGTPPNDWSDNPAPAATDLNYVQVIDDIHNVDTFYVIARWQNGSSNWRSWLLTTSDNWGSVTWQALRSILPIAFTTTHESGDLSEYDATTETGSGTVDSTTDAGLNGTTYGLEAAVTGFGDEAMAFKDIAPTGTTFTLEFYFDLNSLTIPSASPPFSVEDVEVLHVLNSSSTLIGFLEVANESGTYKIRLAFDDDNSSRQFSTEADISDEEHKMEIVFTKAATASSNDGSIVLKVDGTSETSLTGLDYFTQYEAIDQIGFGLDGVDAGISGSCYYDEANASFTSSNATDSYAMSVAIDKEDGSRIYTSIWKDGNFYLERYSSALSLATSLSFATATIGETTGKTYFAALYPSSIFSATGFGQALWVFGRWDDGSTRHVGKSVNAGGSITDIGDASWTTERVGGFWAEDNSTLYAITNEGSGTASLYETTDGGSTWSDISTPSVEVEFQAVSIHPDGRILIGNQDSGTPHASYLDKPYSSSTWQDFNGLGGNNIVACFWIV